MCVCTRVCTWNNQDKETPGTDYVSGRWPEHTKSRNRVIWVDLSKNSGSSNTRVRSDVYKQTSFTEKFKKKKFKSHPYTRTPQMVVETINKGQQNGDWRSNQDVWGTKDFREYWEKVSSEPLVVRKTGCNDRVLPFPTSLIFSFVPSNLPLESLPSGPFPLSGSTPETLYFRHGVTSPPNLPSSFLWESVGGIDTMSGGGG